MAFHIYGLKGITWSWRLGRLCLQIGWNCFDLVWLWSKTLLRSNKITEKILDLLLHKERFLQGLFGCSQQIPIPGCWYLRMEVYQSCVWSTHFSLFLSTQGFRMVLLVQSVSSTRRASTCTVSTFLILKTTTMPQQSLACWWLTLLVSDCSLGRRPLISFGFLLQELLQGLRSPIGVRWRLGIRQGFQITAILYEFNCYNK